jgi:hypothetical protein
MGLDFKQTPRMNYPKAEAAYLIGISLRSLNYMIANRECATRKIGGRVLIPHGEVVRIARSDHAGPIRRKSCPDQ